MEGKKTLTGNEIIELFKKGKKDFSNLRLVATDLTNLNLNGAIFRGCILEGVRFAGSSLIGADFSDVIYRWGGFNAADLTEAVFRRAKILWTWFGNAKFHHTDFRDAELNCCIFVNTNLGGADFTGAKIFKMISSLEEITIDDVNVGFKELFSFAKEVNLPQGSLLFTKSRIELTKMQVGERLKMIYEVLTRDSKDFQSSKCLQKFQQTSGYRVSGKGVYEQGKEYGGNVKEKETRTTYRKK